MNKWISVSDKLPEMSSRYIICTDNGAVCTAFYKKEDKRFIGHVGMHAVYWQPLPMPPIELYNRKEQEHESSGND